MSFSYTADASGRPSWTGVLPGRPTPFFLQRGEGEHAKLFADAFTVLFSADETGGAFGMFTSDFAVGDVIPAHAHADTHETFYVLEGQVRVFVEMPDGEKASRLLQPGDFGFVPAGAPHAYRTEQTARVLGVANGGFERFFQQIGVPTDTVDPSAPPYVPDFPRMQAAAQAHRMEFLPGYTWPDA